LVPQAERTLQECVALGVDSAIVYGSPENNGVCLEHLVPDLRPVVLNLADVVGGASEACLASVDGLAPEVDVLGGLPGLLEDMFEEVFGDPLDEDALVVADSPPAAGVDS